VRPSSVERPATSAELLSFRICHHAPYVSLPARAMRSEPGHAPGGAGSCAGSGALENESVAAGYSTSLHVTPGDEHAASPHVASATAATAHAAGHLSSITG